jgi:hypothetical protein
MDPQLTQLVALLHEITLNNTVHINMTIRLESKDSAKTIKKTYSKGGRVAPKKPTAKMSAFEWNIENEEGSDDGGVEEEVTEDDAHPKAPLSVTTFVEDEDDPTLALVDSHSHEYQVLQEAFFRDTYDSAWPKKRSRTVDIQGRPTIIAFLRIQSECAAIDASNIMYPTTRYSRSTRQRSAKPHWLFFGTAFWCNMGLSLDEDSVVQGQPQPCTLDMCRMCWIARAGKSEMELPGISPAMFLSC